MLKNSIKPKKELPLYINNAINLFINNENIKNYITKICNSEDKKDEAIELFKNALSSQRTNVINIFINNGCNTRCSII